MINNRPPRSRFVAALIALVACWGAEAPAVEIGNPSFEQYQTLSHSNSNPPWGGPTGDTSVAVWEFSYAVGNIDACGINTNGGPWWSGSAPAPDGIRGGYMQNANSRISQELSFKDSGQFVVTFSTIGRHGGGSWTTGRELTVKIGEETVLVIPAQEIGVSAWQPRASGVFSAPAGSSRLTFITGGGGDATAIDNVAIVPASSGGAEMLTCTFPELGPATVDQELREVSITVPFGSFFGPQSPTFTLSPLATINPPSGSERNFNTPQTYTVTSGDGLTTRSYRVAVVISPPSNQCDILSFGLPGNPAVISDGKIELAVPFSTDLELLAPHYTLSPNALCDQLSGFPPFPDFTGGTVPYVVVAEDGVTKKTYLVTVLKSPPSNQAEILSFGIGGSNATISGNRIVMSVPFGSELADLAPSFTLSSNASCDQVSGVAPVPSFADGPVDYVVTAEDGTTTTTYKVEVIVGPKVSFATTEIDVSPGSSGIELKNDGEVVRAYHFGNIAGPTTVRGIFFDRGNQGGAVLDSAISGVLNSPHGPWIYDAINDPAFAQLINYSYVGTGDFQLSIAGLTSGNAYRLQMVWQNPRNGTVIVEGVAAPGFSSSNTTQPPALLSAEWTAKSTTLKLSFDYQFGASPHFSGYVLHDLGPAGDINDYDAWADLFGAAFTSRDPGADPDGDGLTNFEEYLFGLNPASGASASPVLAPFDPRTGTFGYTRRKPSLSNATYVHEWSATLAVGGWTAFTGDLDTVDQSDQVEVVTVGLPASLLSEPQLFVRVRAETSAGTGTGGD
jgi:hypothetical protein